jgi:hypothetical protein
MAETILAVIVIAVGIISGVMAVFIAFANAMGGATNPSAVNFTPALIFATLATACVVGGFAIWP